MAKRLSPYEQMKANGEKILKLQTKKGLTKAQREEMELVRGLTETLENGSYGADLKGILSEQASGAEPSGAMRAPTNQPASRPSAPPTDQPASQPAHQPTNQPTPLPGDQAQHRPVARSIYQPQYRPEGGNLGRLQPGPAKGTTHFQADARFGGLGQPGGMDPGFFLESLSSTQRTILDYLVQYWRPVISYTEMEADLGICYETLRKAVVQLRKAGLLAHRQARIGQRQGVHFSLNQALIKELYQGETPSRPLSQPDAQADGLPPYRPTNRPTAPPTDPSFVLDRKIENLSVKEDKQGQEVGNRLRALADSDIAFFWPTLAKAGFSGDQVRQILDRLAQLGKEPDKVLASLDHAEWELTHGEMKDKSGAKIQNPLGYLFNSLARTGYYRRPPGYVSPEEQAALDREEEAARVRKAKARAEEESFLAWKDSLSREELDKILKGCMGPKEQWLKSHWQKSRRAAEK